MDIKHVVWDWNGTILDDNHAVLAAVNNVCAGFGRAPITMEYWQEIFSRPLLQCYERLLETKLTEQDWARIDKLYHDEYRQLLAICRLAKGVPDHLHAWRESGRTQSLLSMWFHDELVPLVTEYGLTELFDRIDGLRLATGGGSKAEHLGEHLEAQRVDPKHTVLIGDVVDDAEAARSVGARCVLVATGVMNRRALEATGMPVAGSIPEALERI
ncbi:putative phosphatase [Lentzea sp. NBRC 105346]|uniref:HAD family hydrolase n=1 Tax=Lentzea sp. NBRC 105346 TaxID=3032205 RepID=UPI0024A00169|nr:HAD family hydrolase [Lentzea sp. NBRC 105346]GLZ34242.1 putative phosphatase [Lentzea sp. NBRC 105346]